MRRDKLTQISRSVVSETAVLIYMCTTCGVVIAEDRGEPSDIAKIALAIKSHTRTPNIFGIDNYKHEIITTEASSQTCVSGIEWRRYNKEIL